jgi:hypothetical protein
MLGDAHIAPLIDYVKTLRQKHSARYFPYFDPADGGVEADMLFLLEKPGPMTSAGPKTPERGRKKGSGFISRNNDDPTAAATFRFMLEAGISRRRTVLWNVVPGWNESRRITPQERM